MPNTEVLLTASSEAETGLTSQPVKKTEQPCPLKNKKADSTKKDWIKITLQDQFGNPLPREKYKLKTPDGVEREGILDDNGSVFVEGFDPGECQFTLPDLQAQNKSNVSEETLSGGDE